VVVDLRRDGEQNPYRILGTLLVAELSAPAPRLSRRRKRLRAAMRARLTETFLAERRFRDESDGPAALRIAASDCAVRHNLRQN
jgi:hypothetical protein